MTLPLAQAGLALLMALIMLGLLSLLGASAVAITTAHLRLVGNLQAAYEAELAARRVIGQWLCDPGKLGCPPLMARCQILPTCINGRRIDVRIETHCTGSRPASAAGESLVAGMLDTQWDIAATVLTTGQTRQTYHAGVLVLQGGECPQASAALAVCEPASDGGCD